MEMRLSGKTALVTGASRGIGAAIAVRFASEGADVAINCRSGVGKAEEVAERCRRHGVRAVVLPFDVASSEACRENVASALAEFGKIDILVNNAGVTRDTLAIRMTDEMFDEVLSANLKGAFYMARSVIQPMLKARSGRIINISSVAGVGGNAGQANYSAAKAGLIGLTKSLAKEIGSRSVTVNAIAPGFIETDMTANLGEKILLAAKERISLGRIGAPEDIAAAAAFLASDDASYITGQVLVVDGGLAI